MSKFNAPLHLVLAIVATMASMPPSSADAQIYVLNYGQNHGGQGFVSEYTMSGAPINTSLITGLFLPAGMAVCGSDLFVSDTGINDTWSTIYEYTLDGTPVNTFWAVPYCNGIATNGSELFFTNGSNADVGGGVGEFMPSGAAVNVNLILATGPDEIAASGDSLFVSFPETGTVAAYRDDGTTLSNALIGGLVYPFGLAASGSSLYVLGSPINTVSEYNTSGALVDGSLITRLHEPLSLAVSGADMYVGYVQNSGIGAIGEYTTSGAVLNSKFITGLDGPVVIVVVPEPATGSIAAVAGLALLVRRPRRR